MDPKAILEYVLNLSGTQHYPDIHLTSGHKPIVRNNNGEMIILEDIDTLLNQQKVSEIMKILVGEK